MSEFKHKKVVTSYYEISVGGTHRTLGGYIDDFLDESPELEDEDAWNDSHTILRDFDGDFDGIEIHYSDRILPIIEWIYTKLGVDHKDFEGVPIRIVS